MAAQVDMLNPQVSSNLAQTAARVALATNTNILNLEAAFETPKTYPTTLHDNGKHNAPHQAAQKSSIQPSIQTKEEPSDLDRIVESVENATKRLSLISTNTNSSKRKSKNHVGPWRLGRTLGRGSSGRVRLAKHSETGQLAAVKIVPKAKFQKPNSKKDDLSPLGIEREIIIMKLISHQNIMALHDVWENKGELYLVLEYVEGGELFDYLVKKGRLQEDEAIRYFRQIISGVSYCHQFNICHRDLKPENLLLDKNQNIKIADFGMAALEMNQKLLETSCGSPHYASPEIVSGKTYHGSPSDVWSCGIILFALLTGHLPFDDDNIKVLLTKVQTGTFTIPSYISREAGDLIRRMLVTDPEKRIRIFDIINHPLLKKYETSKTLKSSRNDRSKISQYYNKVDKLTLSRDEIDTDILKSLSILFHGTTEAQLVPRLMSSSSNPEKIFYYLLQEYKNINQDTLRKAPVNRPGNGMLKKSKSSVKTLLNEYPPNTNANALPAEAASGLLSSKLKRSFRTPTGKIQIPASRSSQRNVSLNNKSITLLGHSSTSLSRSSSKSSFLPNATGTSTAKKVQSRGKRMSLLPPLSTLDLSLNLESSWSILDSNGAISTPTRNIHTGSGSDIFAPLRSPPALPSFNFNDSLVERDVKNGSPLKNQIVEPAEDTTTELSDLPEIPGRLEKVGDARTGISSIHQNNASLRRKSTISRTTSNLRTLTLDPKFKPRRVSENNAKVLNRFGVKVRENRKSISKLSYMQSNTSLNLNVLLESQEMAAEEDFGLNSKQQAHIHEKANPPSTPLPVPPLDNEGNMSGNTRLASSVYSSTSARNVSGSGAQYSDASSCYSTGYTTFDGADTYKEIPEKTSVAQMITVSNGSNVNVLKSINISKEQQAEEVLNHGILSTERDSSFVGNVSQVADSTAGDLDLSLQTVIHRPLYNSIVSSDNEHSGYGFGSATEFQDSKHYSADYSKNEHSPDGHIGIKKSSSFEDGFEDIDDDEEEDDFESFGEVKKHNLVKSISEQTEEAAVEGYGSVVTDMPKLDLTKNRDIKTSNNKKENSADTKISTSSKLSGSSSIKKSNWFIRFFSSLSNKEATRVNNTAQLKEQVAKPSKRGSERTFKSKIPLMIIKRAIKSTLLLKQQEGLVKNVFETSSNKITARVPIQGFFSSNMVIFEVFYNFEMNSFVVTKTRGPQKWFKKVLKEVEFLVRYEEQRFSDEKI
ncbi:hypothetical protein WICPIJ_007850 [Wickerhamomyces pijperi]|uniref:non-specific serine/threonine protein kinase n=1 Tax=Wickerhamomyces pijperi TaxID=599730 RepID=A0A9P8TJP8_WICPI|nr:hypothetical protein WICPIJ_007850 [Wickerhamomyces pijperi]